MTHGISLTGEKQIILSGGNFDEPDVPEGGFVPAEESAFDEIASQAGNIVGRVDTLLHNLNNIFSSENAENISKAIKNLEVATKNLSSLSQNLDKPISNISEAAGSMKNIMTEIEEAKIAAKAGEDLDVLREKLDAIDTKNINDNLNQAMASVNKLTKRLDQMIYKNEDQVGNAVTELNAVLSNLEEFSQKIKNNPSMLIHSETKERRK
jgi:phospholipid/cholesterol/gamma-HCH transport system substrate-binding protein